jgi:hypothetical protein
MVAGYRTGAARERNGGLDTRHVFISAGATLALILLVVLGVGYQAAMQSLTPRSEGIRCSEFCSARGYSASSVSPQVSASRTCSCLNGSGAAIIEVPLESLK